MSASFLGDFSDDEVSSNPDTTTVKRGELDFEDLHDEHLLDESIGKNIGAAQVRDEFTKASHLAEVEGFKSERFCQTPVPSPDFSLGLGVDFVLLLSQEQEQQEQEEQEEPHQNIPEVNILEVLNLAISL